MVVVTGDPGGFVQFYDACNCYAYFPSPTSWAALYTKGPSGSGYMTSV